MNKDELLRFVDSNIEDYDTIVARVSVGRSPVSKKTESRYIQSFKNLKEIRSILNLHFSISEEERKEAVEWIDVCIGESGHIWKNAPKYMQTILKALGEKVG